MLVRIGKLEAAELAEIRVAAAILPFIAHRTGLPFSAEVYCSDSSDAGFALHVRSCEISEVAAVASVKERRRFKPTVRRPIESNAYALSFQPAD